MMISQKFQSHPQGLGTREEEYVTLRRPMMIQTPAE